MRHETLQFYSILLVQRPYARSVGTRGFSSNLAMGNASHDLQKNLGKILWFLRFPTTQRTPIFAREKTLHARAVIVLAARSGRRRLYTHFIEEFGDQKS
jgi:hypothetical protein